GVVPLGSGNDLARLLGLRPRRVAEALDAALGPTVVRLDVGVACVHGTSVKELFVNQCGFALEPEVVRRLRPGKLFDGSAGYAAAAARALAAFRPRRLTLHADALRVEAEPLLLEVANAPYAGGGFRLAPRADPRDGRLDVCLVERLTWPRLVLALPRALSGTHLGLKGVTYLRAQSVEVRSGSGGPLAFQLDGELREAAGGGVDLGVLPRGLRVAVPEGALR
ncbi:MAG: diacylglycerol kinase family protein, partial [Gemmatimonadota bacterium]